MNNFLATLQRVALYKKVSFCVFIILISLSFSKSLVTLAAPLFTSFSYFISKIFYLLEIPNIHNQNLIIVAQQKILINSAYFSFYWIIGLIFIAIISPANLKNKITFILIVLAAGCFLNVTRLVILGKALSVYSVKIKMIKTFITSFNSLIFGLFLFFWYQRYKQEILMEIEQFNIQADFFKFLIRLSFGLVVVVRVLSGFLSIFYFKWLISFILTSAATLLNLFGQHAYSTDRHLFGNGFRIFMARSCAGVTLMIVFSAFIFLTGKNFKRRIFYILFGVALINILNILRFLFLFFFLKYKSSFLSFDQIHNLYDVMIYFIVFLMWVIWLRKISDHPVVKELI